MKEKSFSQERTERKFLQRRPIIRWIIAITFVLFSIASWFGVSTVAATLKIIDSPSDSAAPILKFGGTKVTPNQLAGEGDGRINILVIGVGGAGHSGGQLADTIMVISIDPEAHQLGLLSIPRDLKVTIPGFGQNKINAAQSLGEQKKKGEGPKLIKETTSKLLDLPIHYYLKVDFAGFRKFIDKIGGITVTLDKNLFDPLYPDGETDGYTTVSIKAGTQNMNGDTALKFARSRETTSDFDRAARQQKVMIASKEKLFSMNVLSNPKKIADLLGIMGDHIRTDLSVNDLERLASLTKDIQSNNIITKVLDNSADGPLMTTNEGGYYLIPKRGDFKDVQRIAHELFADPYIKKEAATVAIVNATGKMTESREIELDLKSLGYSVKDITIGDTQPKTILIDNSNGKKPFTLSYLKQRFKAQIIPTNTQSEYLEKNVNSDVIIVIGEDYLSTTD